jgi:alkyl sulfatase BDS1-like metallo-beta-lactamase superfamily hydrolase
MTGPQGQLAHPVLLARRPPLIPQVIRITDGVWTVHGLSVANSHILDCRTGLVVVDTDDCLILRYPAKRLARVRRSMPVHLDGQPD